MLCIEIPIDKMYGIQRQRTEFLHFVVSIAQW